MYLKRKDRKQSMGKFESDHGTLVAMLIVIFLWSYQNKKKNTY